MADVNQLKVLVDSYAIAVRAGVITPCLADEEYLRQVMGLPPAPEPVRAVWARQDGVRSPITLARENITDESVSLGQDSSDEQ